MTSRPAALLSLFLTACTCGGATAGGPTPYVRCAMREPAVIDRDVGAAHLRTDGRTLTIGGVASPVRVAVFRGAALADEPLAPALDAIEGVRPAVALVLGGLGDDLGSLVAALAELPIPTVVVLGGTDRPEALTDAIDAVPATSAGVVIDASGLRAIEVGGVTLIPVSGAPDGRYARDDGACGLGPADVDAIVSDVGEASGPRFLVGFAAPSPLLGIEGAEAGSTLVTDLAQRIGATGGLFAWPDVPMDRPTTSSPSARILAPALVGPSVVLSDGSRLDAGPLLVEVAAAGLRIVP